MSEFSYFAWDLLSGRLLGQVPLQGVQFSTLLNSAGQLSASLDLYDSRVQATNPLSCTVPNRTLIGVDYRGVLVWGGIVLPRDWQLEGSPSETRGQLSVQCSELWSYFASRVQATDYSAPPTSGITSPMSMWAGTPWDASLIACQVISDAIGYQDSASMPYGNLLGGLGLLLNGATPSGTSPVAPAADYVAVTYPFSTVQTVDTIVGQLAGLGFGVGFDFAVDVAYSSGPGSSPVATINVSYPRRGRTVASNNLIMDLTTSRGYRFPEDGSQTGNTLYEIGGAGAVEVSQAANPLAQGYPIWERVISRAQAQSQNIISLLGQTGAADLALFMYPPVSPTVRLGVGDPNLPLGSFVVGDDVQVFLPAAAPDGSPFDPRFPAGLDQEWRVVGYQVDVADEGDAVMTVNLAQPPSTNPVAPAV